MNLTFAVLTTKENDNLWREIKKKKKKKENWEYLQESLTPKHNHKGTWSLFFSLCLRI